MKVWIVADVLSQDGTRWELIGVFDSEALAVDECRAPNHAVWSMEINVPCHEPFFVPPDVRYPLAEASHA